MPVPMFMGLIRQEYCRRLLCPPPGDLPNLGIEPSSPALAERFFTTESTGKHSFTYIVLYIIRSDTISIIVTLLSFLGLRVNHTWYLVGI